MIEVDIVNWIELAALGEGEEAAGDTGAEEAVDEAEAEGVTVEAAEETEALEAVGTALVTADDAAVGAALWLCEADAG